MLLLLLLMLCCSWSSCITFMFDVVYIFVVFLFPFFGSSIKRYDTHTLL